LSCSTTCSSSSTLALCDLLELVLIWLRCIEAKITMSGINGHHVGLPKVH
jgi:hypothetical protein